MKIKESPDIIISTRQWKMQKKRLVKKSGIYAVWARGKCLYVGKSTDLSVRVRRIYDSIMLNYTCCDTNWMFRVILSHLFLSRSEITTNIYFHNENNIEKQELEAEYFIELNPYFNGNQVNKKYERASSPNDKEKRKEKTRKIYKKRLKEKKVTMIVECNYCTESCFIKCETREYPKFCPFTGQEITKNHLWTVEEKEMKDYFKGG